MSDDDSIRELAEALAGLEVKLPEGYRVLITRQPGGPWPTMDDQARLNGEVVAEFEVVLHRT